MNQKNRQFPKKFLKPSEGTAGCFTEDEQKEFHYLYPTLIICGKSSEYYKCQEPLDFIKQTTEKIYDDIAHFESKFLNNLNKIHK